MHGIRKSDYVNRSEEEKQRRNEQCKTYIEIRKELLANRQKFSTDESSVNVDTQLTCAAQVLLLNPDFQDIWNYRRELLSKKGDSITYANPELELTQKALRKNPKSYPTWFHRQWIWSHFQNVVSSSLLENELELCKVLLAADERNFHCWNYRRFVVSQLENDGQTDELAFSMEKLDQNFSNYSAFHYRTLLLCHNLHDHWKEEMEVCQQAVFTEPDDQSAWFYIKYLLLNSPQPELLIAQSEWMTELQELEQDLCKWPILMRLVMEKKLRSDFDTSLLSNDSYNNLLKILVKIDSDHEFYYRDCFDLNSVY